ncbi:MAG TPA: sulfurtransferase [Candidatus Acidoferrales bacterium]|nr:sulfurtransferase [Candidatus Acidoferrales bacterium]
MTKTHLLSILLLACMPLPAANTCGGHGNKDTMVVSTAWLAAHLNDPNLVILSVGDKADYDKEHIPGARPVSLADIATPMVMGQLMLELLPQDQLQKNFAALGITNDSRIVLYTTKERLAQMTRVYLTLDAMGLGAKASVLDGGLPVWKAENRPLTTEVRAVKPGKLDLCPQSDVIASADWVRANVRHPGVAIIDSRLERFYTGEAAGRNHDGSDQRRGHIPGAANIPFSSLVDDSGKFLSTEQLRQKFAAAGTKPADRVVSYCHIGQQATVVYFVARFLGYDARLYDGSWEDWSAHADWPVETK